MGLWQMKRHDTYPAYSAVLVAASGDVVNLTAATVKFYMTNISDSTVKVNGGTMTGASGGAFITDGVVEYPWLGADTNRAGRFRVEYQVTFPSGKVQTFPTLGYDEVEIGADLNDA